MFWDVKWNNWYDLEFQNLSIEKKTNLDLFADTKIVMIFWYPKMIEDIKDSWFNMNFLRATQFPQYGSGDGINMLKYYYFVANKNSDNKELSFDLLKYFASEEGWKQYVKDFSYILSPQLEVNSWLLEKQLISWYSVKYEDFYNGNVLLESFDKKLSIFFDEKIKRVLDSSTKFQSLFESMRNSIMCKYNKIISYTSFWSNCNK